MKNNPKESNCGDFLPRVTNARVATDSPYEILIMEIEFQDTSFNLETHELEETTRTPQRTYLSRDVAEQLHAQLSEYLEKTEHDHPEAVKKYLM